MKAVGGNYIHLYLPVTQGNWIKFSSEGSFNTYANIHRWSRCINIVACFATDETGVLISFFCMFLILTETGTVDEDGSSTDSDDETGPARKRTAREPVQLTPEQLRFALGYVKVRPYLWWSRRGDYKKMKDERKEAWTELAKKLSLSCEYHFFLFIIVSDGDIPT